MKMKKLIGCIAILMTSSLVLSQSGSSIHAENFEGNEEAWLNRCSIPQQTSAAAQECARFKTYYANKNQMLNNQVHNLDKQVAEISKNVDNIAKTVKMLQGVIEDLNKSIAINEANIKTISGQIEKLNVQIKQKEIDIDQRSKLITGRMLSQQATVGTSMEVEIIMGSDNLIDMIRRVDGLQRITKSDQDEIKILVLDKEKLHLQKNEKDRLKKDAEEKKAVNEKNRAANVKAEQQKRQLLDDYLKQEADLNEKMRSMKVDLATIQHNIININTSVAGDLDFSGNGFLRMPIRGGYQSAGVWYYPGGGVHLGLDIATPIGTRLEAPASGIILYAANPIATNNGFLGNYVGHPAGGGNTIQMLTQVKGTTYALSFFHLAKEGFAVSPGQEVKAGQLMALTGNSGNTTGPHCHLEVINLGNMSIVSAINTFRSSGADFAWGNNWGNSALNKRCDVSGPPCREDPAKIYK